jgi:hypothetical protein
LEDKADTSDGLSERPFLRMQRGEACVAKLVAPPSRANVNEVLEAGFKNKKGSRAMP